MFASTLSLALILSESAVGWQAPEIQALPSPVQVIVPAPAPPALLMPVAPDPEVGRLLVQLQQSPRWFQRDLAAMALRRVDWRANPVVVEALAFSVTNDPDFRVRDASIHTLGKMKPCLPAAHQSLRQAADTDKCLAVRLNARHALRKLPPQCQTACDTCGPGATIVPGAVVAEPPLGVGVPMSPAPPPTASEPTLSAPRDSNIGPAQELSPVPPAAEDLGKPGEIIPPPVTGPSDKPSARRSTSARTRVASILPRLFRPLSER